MHNGRVRTSEGVSVSIEDIKKRVTVDSILHINVVKSIDIGSNGRSVTVRQVEPAIITGVYPSIFTYKWLNMKNVFKCMSAAYSDIDMSETVLTLKGVIHL